MLTGYSIQDQFKDLFGALRMNQYITNWPIVLDALRRLWEIGRVSELKTPFYEPFDHGEKAAE